MPVILVVYAARKDTAYWLYIQSYIRRLSGFNLFAAGQTVTVHLSTGNLLTRATVMKILYTLGGSALTLHTEMSLHQLRKARELTQTKIAEELHMGQGDVSKLERRTDMYVSTLASYLQAVGADLEIRAVFPDGRAVKITQFSE